MKGGGVGGGWGGRTTNKHTKQSRDHGAGGGVGGGGGGGGRTPMSMFPSSYPHVFKVFKMEECSISHRYTGA